MVSITGVENLVDNIFYAERYLGGTENFQCLQSEVFVVAITCILISAGGAPIHYRTGFRYWDSMPFTHGFKGFLSVMSTCTFAVGGSEIGGVVAADARDPKNSVSRAVNTIWVRITAFYVIGSLMATIIVSPQNKDLFGAQGVNASPYVVSFRDTGIPAMAHIMSVVIFISVLSPGTAQAYIATRTLVGLASLGMAPLLPGKCDKQGRPWAAIALTFLLGGGLCYLNVSNLGATVFGWFSKLTSLCILYLWGLIFLCPI